MQFEERYRRLNPSQKEAVDAIDGPVMVIAGPGTGKTTILTLRIANILEKTDTPPGAILAITYTDAGVKAMRMKLREAIGSRADEVRIHTFHGFAASVIAEFADHFPHLARTEQMTDVEAEQIVRDVLADPRFAALRPAGSPDFYVSPIIGAIGEAKKEAWTPEMLRSFAAEEMRRIRSDESSISTRGASKGKLKAEAEKRIERCERTLVLADVFAAYEGAKREKRLMDFNDLIIELLVALKSDELLLRLLQEKFLYLLVDEHQDTNDAQNLLIRMIADFFESPNVFVVGDEKQAIYRFQGASVENFLRFQKVWGDMKVIALRDNYRSHQSILDAAYGMIERNYGEGEHESLRVRLAAGGPEKARPLDVVSAGNTEAAEAFMAARIGDIVAKEPAATVAVIVRSNRDVERALSALDRRGVAAASERGADVFSHPAGALFFDLLRYLSDPSETEALARTLAAGLWGISFEDSATLIRSIRSGDLAGLGKAIPALALLAREKSRKGSLAYLMHAADASGFTRLVSRDPLAVEVWRGILSLASGLIRNDGSESPAALMEKLLAYAAAAESKSVKVGVGDPEARVRVMTAHGSKGLEFDYVFIPYATEESWMPRARASYFALPRERDDSDNERDSRRLFYVALTRAKKHATILSGAQEAGKELVPARFIGELAPEHVATIDIPAESADAASAELSRTLSKRESELAAYAKRSLLERGLSVTALNHFIRCPSEFFYKSVMRLPEAPNPSSERGNAMHEAISLVWRSAERSEKEVAATMEASVRSYLATKSLLPTYEKEPLLKELLEDIPRVARALAGHFSLEGEVFSETWSERSFDPIRLHGKLDAVIVSGEQTLVFDYKSRAVMSENEIKGLTKNSTGDYFRQLVFYKLLLAADPKFKGKSIRPALVFVRPDEKGRCPIVELPIEKADEEAVLAEIKRLIESVWSGDAVRASCDDPRCEWCALKKLTADR